MLVKICGIKTSHMAEQAVKVGANFIGIVFAKNSKRNVTLEQAIEIAKATKQAGAEPVAVFMDDSFETIIDICEKTGIKTVQLHGENIEYLLKKLPIQLNKIIACSSNNVEKFINYLDVKKDFLLFDNAVPGSGEVFDWDDIHYSGEIRWFLAGGLTVDNVRLAIERLKPNGLDVSSGVENAGEKDESLIQQFIDNIRRHIKN